MINPSLTLTVPASKKEGYHLPAITRAVERINNIDRYKALVDRALDICICLPLVDSGR
jgi:hypothetical protein